MDKARFSHWLQAERKKRGWSQSRLSFESGLSRQIINRTESGTTAPSVETLVALAKALGYSPLILIRQAGLIPPVPESEEDLEEITYLLEQTPPEKLKRIRRFMAEMNGSENPKGAPIVTP